MTKKVKGVSEKEATNAVISCAYHWLSCENSAAIANEFYANKRAFYQSSQVRIVDVSLDGTLRVSDGDTFLSGIALNELTVVDS